MAIYLVQIVIILLMGLYFKPERKERGRKVFCVLSFLLLWFVSAFRADTVGADTPVYVSLYRNIGLYNVINVRYEPGFILYLKGLHAISSQPVLMLAASSAIVIGTMCYLVFRASKQPMVSILLYIMFGGYHGQMNTMRQSIAIAFTVLAFLLLMSRSKKYKILSALMIGLASTFQYVALVCFVPYVMLVRESSEERTDITLRKRMFRSMMYALIAFLAYTLVMQLAIRIFPSYAHYLTNSRWSDSNYFGSFFKSLIHIVFLITGAIVFRNKKLDGFQHFLSIMLGFAVIFNVLSMRMEIWSRVSSMFSAYTTLVFAAEIVDEVKERKTRHALMGAILLGAFAYMIITLHFRPEWLRVVPYSFR